jgi:hypothetical protein
MTKGTRAAMLGQAGYLPFERCVFMLLLLSVIIGVWGALRLKKQLDFV